MANDELRAGVEPELVTPEVTDTPTAPITMVESAPDWIPPVLDDEPEPEIEDELSAADRAALTVHHPPQKGDSGIMVAIKPPGAPSRMTPFNDALVIAAAHDVAPRIDERAAELNEGSPVSSYAASHLATTRRILLEMTAGARMTPPRFVSLKACEEFLVDRLSAALEGTGAQVARIQILKDAEGGIQVHTTVMGGNGEGTVKAPLDGFPSVQAYAQMLVFA